MRKLPVVQVSVRLQAAAVTAESARIDSEIGASLLHCKRPHISSATNGRRFGTLETRLGHTKIESTVRYLGIEVDDALAIAEQVDV
jgi:hypothetical protein